MHSSLYLVIYFFFVQHLHANAFAQANGIGKIELYFCSYFKLISLPFNLFYRYLFDSFDSKINFQI